MVSVNEALQAAVQHHQSGEFEQAGSLYEQVLRLNPNHPDALQLVGVMSHQLGRPYDAIQFIERAISFQPDVPEFHNNLAAAWIDASNPSEAARCCRRAIELKPRYAEAHCNLGNALQAMGELAEAEDECRRAVELAPEHANSYFNLGNIQRDRGEIDDAVGSYQQAIRINPSHFQALNNLGQVLVSFERFFEAAQVYKQALRLAPNEPAILRNLAAVEAKTGQADAAVTLYEMALKAAPGDAPTLNSLGLVLHGMRRFSEAGEILEEAIQRRPDFSEAYNNLGLVREAQGQRHAAIDCYKRALSLTPESVASLCNVGAVLRDIGEYAAAREALEHAVHLQSDCVEALNNLGTVLQSLGELDKARVCYVKCIRLRPSYADAVCNLAGLANRSGALEESERLFRSALQLNPNSVAVLNNLGNLMREKGRLDEAETLLGRAVELDDGDAEFHNNLANVLKSGGRIAEAIDAYDRALSRDPGMSAALSNQLVCRQYIPEITLRNLADEHAKYDAALALPLRAQWQPFSNNRAPDRPLRVGFVSSDFGCHPVGFLLVRGFESLSRDQFETFCYSNRPLEDELTDRIRATASSWRDVCSMTDEELARQIRSDEIDVLVDLAGHTAGNRLLVFARKPAPVQVTWLGYVGSTGLTAMDYLLTDRFHVPQTAERFYVEQVVRLPESHIVFEPPSDSPEVGPLPLTNRGHATFASFNNPAKISEQVVKLWSGVLKQVEKSHLLLKYRGFDDQSNSDRYWKLFSNAGVDQDRVEIEGWSPPREMLDAYNGVDVTLDPFPFTGGMTTLYSLWMGVPVITVAGETFASRQSMSFLSQMGLTELIADDHADYISRAASLVRDMDRLDSLRSSLRQRLLDSPLCNSDHFARSIESAFREMWRKWCEPAASLKEEAVSL